MGRGERRRRLPRAASWIQISTIFVTVTSIIRFPVTPMSVPRHSTGTAIRPGEVRPVCYVVGTDWIVKADPGNKPKRNVCSKSLFGRRCDRRQVTSPCNTHSLSILPCNQCLKRLPAFPKCKGSVASLSNWGHPRLCSGVRKVVGPGGAASWVPRRRVCTRSL